MDYGRNFGIRISGPPERRKGRYKNGATRIPIGAPVLAGAVDAFDGRQEVSIVAGDTAPVVGRHGIVVFEHAWSWNAGQDPNLALPSDMDFVPPLAPCQLIDGSEWKFWFLNTDDNPYLTDDNVLGGKTYVAPANLAGLAVGDGLRPADDPSDANGYWAKAGVGEGRWLSITLVNADEKLVEAELVF